MSKDTYTDAQLKRREPVRLLSVYALPCPFCGASAYRRLWHGGGPAKTAVYCGAEESDDGVCYVSPMVTGNTRSQALARWNTRGPK